MVFQEQNKRQLTMAIACIKQSRNMALLRRKLLVLMLHSLGANQSSEMTMQSVLAPHFVVITQCSPYQEVTGKSYHLKQHFLLPATV